MNQTPVAALQLREVSKRFGSKAALDGLEGLGLAVDPERNGVRDRQPRLVSPDGARVAVAVVPTDEELEIATQARGVIRSSQGQEGD